MGMGVRVAMGTRTGVGVFARHGNPTRACARASVPAAVPSSSSHPPSAQGSLFGEVEELHAGLVPWTACAEFRYGMVAVVALQSAWSRGEMSRGAALAASLLLLAHINRLYSEARYRMRHALTPDELHAEAWHGVALSNADQLRLFVAQLPFTLGRTLVSVADFIAPRPVKFYCHPAP